MFGKSGIQYIVVHKCTNHNMQIVAVLSKKSVFRLDGFNCSVIIPLVAAREPTGQARQGLRKRCKNPDNKPLTKQIQRGRLNIALLQN